MTIQDTNVPTNPFELLQWAARELHANLAAVDASECDHGERFYLDTEAIEQIADTLSAAVWSFATGGSSVEEPR